MNGLNRSFAVLNAVVSYNGGDFMFLVERSIGLNLTNRRFDSIGLSVIEKEGRLEIFGAVS